METENKHFLSRLLPALALAAFSCVLWGSAVPCVKIGYELFGVDRTAVPNIWLYAGIRFMLAGVLVIAFEALLHKRLPAPSSRAELWHVAVLALFQTAGQYGFYYIGLANTPGVKASILNGTGAIVLIVISALIFRQEKLTAKKLLAGFVGLAGIIIMNTGSAEDYSSFSFIGEGFLLISIISSSISSCYTKLYSKTDDPVMLSGWQFFAGGIVLALMGVFSGGSIRPSGAAAYAMMLYLALVSALAYTIWSVLLKYNPVSRIAVCKFMIPVFGVILSALMLGETLNIMCFAALALVVCSIIIANK